MYRGAKYDTMLSKEKGNAEGAESKESDPSVRERKMKRVLLKLSGEALSGEKKTGFDEATVLGVARQVLELDKQAGPVGFGMFFERGEVWPDSAGDFGKDDKMGKDWSEDDGQSSQKLGYYGSISVI